jgi:hypothetical protein
MSQKVAIGRTVTSLTTIAIMVVAATVAIGYYSTVQPGKPTTAESRSSGIQSAIKQTIGNVTTITSTSGVVTTVIQTALACNNSPGASEPVCLYIEGWAFNYTSSTLIVIVGNQGPGTDRLANMTFAGSPTNKGFTGSVALNLDSLSVPSKGFEQNITSPNLPNLQRDDQVIVTVRGIAGAYFVANFTATPV